MNYIKHIALLVFCFGLGAGASWGQSAHIQDNPRFNQLGKQFTQEKLSQIDREAFEQRALEKLRDLGDYLTLASSASYHADMRAEAARLALELFRSENERFIYFVPENKPTVEYGPVSTYLEGLWKDNRFNEVQIAAGEVRILQEARPDESGAYRGWLFFDMNMKLEHPATGTIEKTFQGKMDFWVLREKKTFGQREKLVWVTKLGGMEKK